MGKFTKGHWRIEGENIKTAISSSCKHIAMVNYFDCGKGDPRSISKEEHEANAHLIAAAPEMYEALENLIQVTKHLQPCPATLGAARDALKKARGE